MSPERQPHDWRLLTVGDVLINTQCGLNRPSSDEANLPIVGMKDLVGGQVRDFDLVRVSISDEDARPFMLREGDLLLNRTNSPDLVGKIGYVAKPIRAVFASYLIRLEPDPAIIDTKVSRSLAFVVTRAGRNQAADNSRSKSGEAR